MAMTEMNYGESGVSLDVSLVDNVVVQRGVTKTYTIDTSKDYIVTAGYKYNDSLYRTHAVYLNKGNLVDLTNNYTTSGIDISLSGSTLTLTSSASTYYVDITLIQLD